MQVLAINRNSVIIRGTTSYNMHMADQYVVLPFGRALRMRRDKLGLTQQALIDRMGIDTDQTNVSKWENRSLPVRNYDTLQAMSRALGATVEELLEGRVPAEWLGIHPTLESEQSDDPLVNLIEDTAREYKDRVSPKVMRQSAKMLEGFYNLGEREQEHFLNQLELLLLIHRPHPPEPPPDQAARTGG